jgi:hypothetical protein
MPGFREFPSHSRPEVAVRLAQAELAVAGLRSVLGREGVEFLVLKGAHLAFAYYPNPSDRPFCDLDLLVRPAQFDGAVAALEGAEFCRFEEGGSRAATVRHYYCYEFRAPSGICVELHRAYAAYGRYPVDVDGLLGRAVPFRLGQEPALGLCREDLLVHLCVHIAKGFFCWNEPKHLRDIAAVLSAGSWTGMSSSRGLRRWGCGTGPISLWTLRRGSAGRRCRPGSSGRSHRGASGGGG